MSPQSEFPLVFEGLKNILKPFEPNLTVTADTPRGYSLDGPYSEKWQKQLFFGAASMKRRQALAVSIIFFAARLRTPSGSPSPQMSLDKIALWRSSMRSHTAWPTR